MSFEALVHIHGYWIVFLGTFFEGETIVILAGIAAHAGYLRLPYVMLAAFAGSTLCDQTFFYLGRRHGHRVLARRPGWQASLQRADGLIERHDFAVIVGFRFLYGLRTVIPFALGMSSAVSVRRFVFLNAIGAIVWSIAISVAGYAMGNAVEALLGKARHFERLLFAAVAAAGALIWVLHFARQRRLRTSIAEPRVEP